VKRAFGDALRPFAKRVTRDETCRIHARRGTIGAKKRQATQGNFIAKKRQSILLV
jgi:hypothetical protein